LAADLNKQRSGHNATKFLNKGPSSACSKTGKWSPTTTFKAAAAFAAISWANDVHCR
jgi:hypothetical protein